MLHSLPKSPPRFLTFALVITLQPWGGVISLLKSSITLYCRNRMGNYSAKSPTFDTSFCFGSDVCWEKLLRPYPPVCYMLEWVWKLGIDKFFCHGHTGNWPHTPTALTGEAGVKNNSFNHSNHHYISFRSHFGSS